MLDAPPDTIMLDAPTAARVLSLSLRHLQKLTSEGVVPSAKIGKRRLYHRADLEQWAREQVEAATAARGGYVDQ